MADYNALKAVINAYIKQNGVQAITGQILNGVLIGMVNALGKGYTVVGEATPSTDPGTMTGPASYIANTAGVYEHFDNISVDPGEVAMLIYNEAQWHKETIASLDADATVDGTTGTPSVDVSWVNGRLTFAFHDIKGEQGNPGHTGPAAGFGTPTAEVDGNVGTPGVSVTASGPDTAKVFSFQFTNLKGAQGDQGIQGPEGPEGPTGPAGVTSVVVTVDNTSGNPTCTASLVSGVLTLAFTGLKGAQGDTGSSVAYPFTIVNNVTTDDATQALSAAMGVQLEGEISQLEQEVDDISANVSEIKSILPTTESAVSGRIIQLTDVESVPGVIGSSNYTFAGRNLLDVSTRVTGKIKNDSGVETNDGVSNYFAQFIPAYGGMTISASFNLQRIYYYDVNKNWLGRSESQSAFFSRTIPADIGGQAVGWIQIQIQVANIDADTNMVNYGESVDTFEAYQSNSGSQVYYDYTVIYDNSLSEISVLLQTLVNVQEKLISGENIKTINGESVLGGGDLDISPSISGITNEITLSGTILEITNDGNILDSSVPSGVTISGRNLVDGSSRKYRTIKNDSGVETSDYNSSYYTTFIPAYGGGTISANTVIQRVYYYDIDKNWIGRSIASVEDTTRVIPATVNSIQVGWVQVQVNHNNVPADGLMVNYGETVADYEAYKSNTEDFYLGYNLLYKDDLSSFSVIIRTATQMEVPAFSMPSVWEPSSVDSGYSSPIGSINTIRENWTAADKYTYYEFLAHYYDSYIGGSYADGYKVTKRSLGNDCSNLGYEMFEYDFCPANYTKVVLLSAGMNTNETSGIWGLATFIRELMSQAEATMQFLHDNVRFIVLPIICPSSFDLTPLKYENYNGVRVNKNFNNRDSWDYIHTHYTGQKEGAYPDSEAETRNLKEWINKYSGIADFYIDCHSDDDSTGDDYNTILTQVICSDATIKAKIDATFSALVDFYADKGYIEEGVTAKTQSWVEVGTVYPKTKYVKENCLIPSIMIEQYICSTMYGSDGQTNNDTYGIKNYVTMLRMYVMAALVQNATVVPTGTIPMNGYRVNYK